MKNVRAQIGDPNTPVRNQGDIEAIFKKNGVPMQSIPGLDAALLPQATTPQATGSPEIEAARAAIKGGKDRNAVIARLKEHGVDPSGL